MVRMDSSKSGIIATVIQKRVTHGNSRTGFVALFCHAAAHAGVRL